MEDSVEIDVRRAGTSFTVERRDHRGLGTILRNPLIQNVLPHLDPEDERKLMQAVVRTEKRREMRRMEQKREQIKQETKFIREIGRKADRKILPKTTAKLLVREKRKRAKSPKRKPGTSEPLPLLFDTHPTTDTADEAAETATPGPSNASAGETIVTDGSPAEASTPAVTTNENPKPSTSSLVQDATHDTQDAPPTNSPQSPEPAHANVTAAAEHAPATAEEPEANGTFELARRTAKVKPPPAAAGTACATSNKYDALDEDAQTPPAPPPPKTQQNTQHPKHERLPPIVATYPDTYKKMYDLITAAIGDERFHAKSAGGDKIKITLKTIDDYNTTKNTLKQHHIPHYTYPTGAQKTLKVVLRGFPTRTDPADIKDAITAKGYDVRTPFTWDQSAVTRLDSVSSSSAFRMEAQMTDTAAATPSEHAQAAAAPAPRPAVNEATTTVVPSAAPPGYVPLTGLQLFAIMNRMAKAATASEREAAEKAYERFKKFELAATSPGTAKEEVCLPSGALPGVSNQEDTALPEAALKGAVPPGLVPQTTNVLSAPSPVQTNQEAADLPSTAQKVTTIPEANLEQLLLHEEAMDVALPSRKRPATTDEDEPPASALSSVHRLTQKKKQHAPEGAKDEEAAQEEEGEFVVPKRRHTARAKMLETVTPLQTTNSFAAVQDDNEDTETGQVPIKQAPAPPPITIQWKEDYNSFLQLFKDVPSLSVKTQGPDLLRTTVRSMDDYRRAMNRPTPLFQRTLEFRTCPCPTAQRVDIAKCPPPPASHCKVRNAPCGDR
ncbi:uncharacterized protein LOC126285039 [Schistocerca gregaria]|uniref:uncharacterized protein LOC126285039 n=1 Tax=Schistocerca gregaria TaxID=7010 RepID=UPI00211EB963|nr:uncharacterized protein LOC126285039 [Schistocerca gregaria]